MSSARRNIHTPGHPMVFIYPMNSRRTFTHLVAIYLFSLNALPSRADWPEFRGPFGNGHVAAESSDQTIGLPLSWSETETIRWKTAIPHLGWSTPVVLNGQVWVTTATENGHDYYAI